MYYPFFHGKQYELAAIRASVDTLRNAGFIPIIEPVNSAEKLLPALNDLKIGGVKFVLITNPISGIHAGASTVLERFVEAQKAEIPNLIVGIYVTADTRMPTILRLLRKFQTGPVMLLHNGFSDGVTLSRELAAFPNVQYHAFFENACTDAYKDFFRASGVKRIVLRDGFVKRPNAQYPSDELYNDHHLTYASRGMDGFGDFTVVGERLQGGWLPRAVALHLSYQNPANGNALHIRHFVSDDTSGTTDSPKKTRQALTKLVNECRRTGTPIHRTAGAARYIEVYDARGPLGLGVAKKFSMMHHIETLAVALT